jgi:hypothetical protein
MRGRFQQDDSEDYHQGLEVAYPGSSQFYSQSTNAFDVVIAVTICLCESTTVPGYYQGLEPVPLSNPDKHFVAIDRRSQDGHLGYQGVIAIPDQSSHLKRRYEYE